MHNALRAALLCSGLLAGPVSAQPLSFDDFAWTFAGPPGGSGSVSSELMHVSSPAYGQCSNGEVWTFTTTAPWAGTVRVHLDWAILDMCHFDWPVYVVNGNVVTVPVGYYNCFIDDEYELAFDVQAGDVFGLGVGSMDCWKGPGIAEWTQFSFLPPAWLDAGGALDPRFELEFADTPPAHRGSTRTACPSRGRRGSSA